MATGNGKIAHLPAGIRNELNYRINDGVPGNELAEWLNSKPEVIEVLNERFAGRAISEQNLSEWRKHGYQQWLALHSIVDESDGASESAEYIAETGINCERLMLILTGRYAELIQRWNLMPTDHLNYKMGIFKDLTDAVLALRRAELQAVRLEIARERLELLREKRRGNSASSSSAAAASSADSASAECSARPDPVEPPRPIAVQAAVPSEAKAETEQPQEASAGSPLQSADAPPFRRDPNSSGRRPPRVSRPPGRPGRPSIETDPDARSVQKMFGMV
jgi:hypothetical protein